jgi:precorrin-4/cobalt-precorrin-4 C11-methyltransferase
MVIFLSAGMTEDLQRELIAGGYGENSPAAIVYKATWPDERVLRCTVGTLAVTASQNGISNLALILVGGFLGDDYELSKLYDPAFTTAFRRGRET